MERRLILMRHAKSSWKHAGLADHERPLNHRGKRDAPRVARALLARGWAPGAVVTSSAERAIATWARMEPVLGELPHTVDEDLYHAGLVALCDAAARWPADVGALLVIGHNPGWEDAVTALSGVETTMTTGNAALLAGAGATWDAALDGPWRLESLLQPKKLPKGG
ncbi:MAG: histidine phosphatase family protein [Myxococcales bacterium]|nr:histidine phosphatase family protein [Myxococcales bacterium]MCB9732661.1 histidine phosphatase family protein [Deltaproteobacteria bacterium]